MSSDKLKKGNGWAASLNMPMIMSNIHWHSTCLGTFKFFLHFNEFIPQFKSDCWY